MKRASAIMEQSVRTVATAASVQDLAALPIVLPDNRTLRLDAIADVRDGTAEQRQVALLDGKSDRRLRSDARRGRERARRGRWREGAWSDRMAARYPNIKFTEVSNTVDYVRESYKDSMRNAVRGLDPRDHRRVVLPEGLARDAGFVDRPAALGAARRSGCCTTCSATR